VCEPADAIGAAPISASSWFDTGAPVDGVGSAAGIAELVTGLQEQTSYQWRLRIRTSSLYAPCTQWASLSAPGQGLALVRTGEAVSSVPETPAHLSAQIEDVSPNPLRSRTRIAFAIDRRGEAILTIHDVSGRRVATLLDGPRDAGRHFATWDGLDDGGREVPSGLYFARLRTGAPAAGGDHRKVWVVR
jgi:hypothetical protein